MKLIFRMFSGFPHFCSDRLWPRLGLLPIPLQERRWLSSVGVVTSYQLYDRAPGVPFPNRAKGRKYFCVLKLAHKTGTGWLFPANISGCEADRSQISSTEAVILWFCTSVSQYAFMISRIKPTDNFAFDLTFSYEMPILCVCVFTCIIVTPWNILLRSDKGHGSAMREAKGHNRKRHILTNW